MFRDKAKDGTTRLTGGTTGGSPGDPGPPGLSAYEIAVEFGGFVGTELDWLASLEGTDGVDGTDGTNGTNGTDGIDGTNGVDGFSRDQYMLPTGVKRSSIDPMLYLNNFAGFLTGRVTLVRIAVKAGETYNAISFFSGTTPAGTPTNQIFGLYDQSLNLLKSTANDTTTAWAANTRKRLVLTSSYTPSVDGWIYAAAMITATTVPTLSGVAAPLMMTGMAPITAGISGSGYTTALPDPAPAPAAMVGVAGVMLD